MKKIRGKIMMQLKNLNIENKTVGLKPRSNKRLYQYGALFVAIIMVFSSIGYATIKLGEDGSSQKWFGDDSGLITNSKGKAWTATGANLQTAIWDLNGTGGKVVLPSGTFSLPSNISLSNVTLLGINAGGTYNPSENPLFTSIINLAQNTSIIVSKGGRLCDLTVLCPSGHGGNAVVVEGEQYFWGYTSVLNNVKIIKMSNSNGTGLLVRAMSVSSIVALCTFNNIYIEGFKYGMKTEQSGSGYCNGNQYSNVILSDSQYLLTITGGDGGSINNLQLEPAAGGSTIRGIYLSNNYWSITNVMTWDWGSASGNGLEVSGEYNTISGYLSVETVNSGKCNYILNNGNGESRIFSSNVTEFITRDYIFITPNGTNDVALIEVVTNTHGDGCKVVFMPGLYDFEKKLSIIHDYTQLYCMPGAIFKLHNGVNDHVFGISADHITIEGGEIDGNRDNNAGTIHGISAEQSNFTVKDITIKNCTYAGISVDDDDILVENCYFENSYYGVWLKTGSRNKIEGCMLYNNVDDGLYCQVVVSDISILNNYVDSNGAEGLHLQLSNSIISSNHIMENNLNGISALDLADSVICDNIIHNNNAGGGTSANIFLESASNNVTITDNILRKGANNVRDGIKLTGSDYNYIVDNNIRNAGSVNNIDTGYGTGNIIMNNLGALQHNNYFVFPTVNSTLPAPVGGFSWFNTTSNVLNIYNGVAWVSTTLS